MNINPVTKQTFSDFTALWKQAFGDGPEAIEEILSCLGKDQQSFLLEDNGRICSALTQFYMGDLIFPSDHPSEAAPLPPLPVLVSYAISTDPEAREQGYGSAITAFAQKEAGRQGAISMLSPAEPELVSFYEPLGYSPLFPAVTETLTLPVQTSASDSENKASFDAENRDAEIILPIPLTPSQYFSLREQFLASVPHIRLSNAAQRFAEWCCSAGGFFLFEEEGILLAMERGVNDTIVIPELLTADCESITGSGSVFPSKYGQAEAWLTSVCGNDQTEISISTPAVCGCRTASVQAMISFQGLSDEIRSAAEEILLKPNRPETKGYAPYFGFTFG